MIMKKVENEVAKILKVLGPALNLKEEKDKASLESFVDYASEEFGTEEANQLLQNVIFTNNHIENRANSEVKEIAKKLPNRSYEEVRQKLMRVESIYIAVAIHILSNEVPDYAAWLYETGIEVIEENDMYEALPRLEAVVNYMNKLN